MSYYMTKHSDGTCCACAHNKPIFVSHIIELSTERVLTTSCIQTPKILNVKFLGCVSKGHTAITSQQSSTISMSTHLFVLSHVNLLCQCTQQTHICLPHNCCTGLHVYLHSNLLNVHVKFIIRVFNVHTDR